MKLKNSFFVSCPIDTYSGYGARSRDFVKALIELDKYNVKILPQRWGNTPFGFIDNNPEWEFLRNYVLWDVPAGQVPEKPDIWCQITVPNEFQPVGKFNIGVSAGIETTIYPGEFLEGSNRMNLNLVSSEHSKKVALNTTFEKRDKNTQQKISDLKLEKPIEVLFEGLDLNKYFKKPQNSELLKDIPEEFCFLYTGHWLPGAYGEDRKNTGKLIHTFFAIVIATGMAAIPPGGAEWSWANAGKGGLILWPLFGATNQLLAGLSFLVITFYLWRRGRAVWFLVIPMIFMLIMPIWAMTYQLFLAPGWLVSEQPNMLLGGIGLATIALEIWMIFEAIKLFPKAKGILEEHALDQKTA